MTDLSRLTPDELRSLALIEAIKEGPASLAHQLDQTYQRVEHTDLISAEIARAVREGHWLQFNTPPQVGKTLTAIHWAAFWALVVNPRHRIVILSYNADYAARNGKAVRELVRKFGAEFGLHPKRSSDSTSYWELTSGGSVLSSGLQGGVTGNTGTLLLIDDYLKNREEADSARYRAKILSNLTTGGFTRRSPNAPVIYTGTLWSGLEASQVLLARYGRVEDGGKWRVIQMPAYATTNIDPLGRRIGEPLRRVDPIEDRTLTFAESTEWWEEQRRGQNPRDWQALYQCNITSVEGALMTDAEIDAAIADPPMASEIVASCLAVDPADGDDLATTANDLNGISHVARTKNGQVWVLGDYTIAGPIETWTKRVVELAGHLEVDEIVYERNKGGRAVGVAVMNAWSAALAAGTVNGPPPRVIDVIATKNKITRASPVVQLMRSKEALISSTANISDLRAELVTYQLGSADSPDRMDAMVWGVTRMYRPRRRPAASKPVAPQESYIGSW